MGLGDCLLEEDVRLLSSEICVKTSGHWLDCQHSDVIPLNDYELKKYSYLTRKQQQEEADPEIVQENYSSRSSTTVGYHQVENCPEESSFSVEQNDHVQTSS